MIIALRSNCFCTGDRYTKSVLQQQPSQSKSVSGRIAHKSILTHLERPWCVKVPKWLQWANDLDFGPSSSHFLQVRLLLLIPRELPLGKESIDCSVRQTFEFLSESSPKSAMHKLSYLISWNIEQS